jgi:hypothetical protein
MQTRRVRCIRLNLMTHSPIVKPISITSNVRVHVVGFRNRHEPVISHLFLPSSCSPSITPTRRARTAQPAKAGSSMSRRTSMGLRHRRWSAEGNQIIGKYHAGRKYLLQRENALVWIEAKFVPASLRSFNNGLEYSIFLSIGFSFVGSTNPLVFSPQKSPVLKEANLPFLTSHIGPSHHPLNACSAASEGMPDGEEFEANLKCQTHGLAIWRRTAT